MSSLPRVGAWRRTQDRTGQMCAGSKFTMMLWLPENMDTCVHECAQSRTSGLPSLSERPTSCTRLEQPQLPHRGHKQQRVWQLLIYGFVKNFSNTMVKKFISYVLLLC